MPIPNAIRPSGSQQMNETGVEGATVIDNVQDRIDYLDSAKAEASAVLTTEQVQDLVAAMIVAGSNVSATYDDTAGTLTISSTGGGGGGSMTREEIEDLLASSFVAGAGVTVVYSDAGNSFTVTNTDGGAAAVAAHAALPDPHPGYETTAEGTAKANAAQAAAEATAAAALTAHHASSSADHDDRYYTEVEVDSALAGKAAASHVHSGADITSGTVPVGQLPTGTSGSTVALGNHTHAAVTITGQVEFGISGAATVRTGALRIYNDSGRARTITSVRLSAGTAPTGTTSTPVTGAAMVGDANIGGTSIFTTQANRPAIPSGSNTHKTTGIGTTTWNDGAYLTMDIDFVGSTVAGSDVTMTVSYTESA